MAAAGLATAVAWDLVAWPLLRSSVPSRFAANRVPGESRGLRWAERCIERSALLSEAFVEPAWRLEGLSEGWRSAEEARPAGSAAGGGGSGAPGGGGQSDTMRSAVGGLSLGAVRLFRGIRDAFGKGRDRLSGRQALQNLAAGIPVDVSRVYEVDATYHALPLWKVVPSPEERAAAVRRRGRYASPGGALSGASGAPPVLRQGCGAPEVPGVPDLPGLPDVPDAPDAPEIYRPVAKFLKLRRVIRHDGGRASLSPGLLSWYSTTPYTVKQLCAAGDEVVRKLRREGCVGASGASGESGDGGEGREGAKALRLDNTCNLSSVAAKGSETLEGQKEAGVAFSSVNPEFSLGCSARRPRSAFVPIGPRQVREGMTFVSVEMLLAEEVEKLVGKVGKGGGKEWKSEAR